MKTTICGTDLHILQGVVATCAPDRILGHECIGIVDSVGAGVTVFQPGDRRPCHPRSSSDATDPHRFKLDQSLDAYDTFGRAVETKALRVIIGA